MLYVFSNTDPEYYANLLFFIKHGIPGCDSCDYIIVINQGPTEEVRCALLHMRSCHDVSVWAAPLHPSRPSTAYRTPARTWCWLPPERSYHMTPQVITVSGPVRRGAVADAGLGLA